METLIENSVEWISSSNFASLLLKEKIARWIYRTKVFMYFTFVGWNYRSTCYSRRCRRRPSEACERYRAIWSSLTDRRTSSCWSSYEANNLHGPERTKTTRVMEFLVDFFKRSRWKKRKDKNKRVWTNGNTYPEGWPVMRPNLSALPEGPPAATLSLLWRLSGGLAGAPVK